MLKRAGKILFYVVFITIGLVGTLYGVFLGIMTATENHWVVAEPFHESIDAVSTKPHRIVLIDDGASSLAYQLHLIDSAKSTIELEFFIYELDSSSRLVTQALARRAREGVEVRLLVDFSLAVLELAPAYADLLAKAGVQVRYYNTSSVARFFTVQHRTHRKIMIIDGKEAIVGGRNVADDYFDLSDHYNFLDSDISVSGDIVKPMKESFELYWDSPLALTPDGVKRAAEGEPIRNLLDETEDDRSTLQLIKGVDTSVLPQSSCSHIRFVTDYPGSSVNFRKVYRAIVDILKDAGKRVLAESPYFIIRNEGGRLMKSVTERGVKISVLTNSLGSTDAYYTVAATYPKLDLLAQENFDLLAYRGTPLPGYGSIPNRTGHWGVHAKRAIVDDRTAMIGTYNLDPRSANLNAELMVVCYDSESLVQLLESSIEGRAQNAVKVISGTAVNHSAMIGDASWDNILMMYIVMPVSHVFDFLL